MIQFVALTILDNLKTRRINKNKSNQLIKSMVILTTCGIAHGCSSTQVGDAQSSVKEVPVSEAKVGDVLVKTNEVQVILTAPFKPGQPNGLYDGGVKSQSTTGDISHYEVNAICSMPDLQGWPEYDNIYGKIISDPSEAGKEGGNTQWQLLLMFDGEQLSKGEESAPSWAKRLAQNLCRKGAFDDSNIEVQTTPNKTKEK